MAFTPVNDGDLAVAPQLQQIIDALQGVAGAGQPISLTSLDSVSDWALTLRNLGANGQALRIQNSSGVTIMTASDAGFGIVGSLGVTGNVDWSGVFQAVKQGSVTAAASGYSRLYPKADEQWYRQTSGGDEVLILDADLFTAAGQILRSTAAETASPLSIGTARQVLAVNSGATDLEYVSSLQSLMTAQGDIVQASAANTPARLALGTARQVLAVNAGVTALEYVASPASLLTAQHDLLTASAANAPARLATGTSNQVLHGGNTWGSVVTGDIATDAVTQSAVATTGAADSTMSTTFVDMANLSITMTTTGGNVMVWMVGAATHSAAGTNVQIGFQVDAASTVSGPAQHSAATIGESKDFSNLHLFTGLSSGSHTFKSRWLTSGGQVTAYGGRTMIALELKR